MKPERDIYFQKALEAGYLARSAYKLLQIDEVFNILEGVTKAVDLCSAPGSWTQVLCNKLHNVSNNYDSSKLNPNVKIVSVDMMPMEHFPGVIHLQDDISQYSTMKLILEQFGDEKVDIVVCDGSIDVVGLKMIDYYMHHRIFLAALYVTLNILKTGGNFVMKIFIGKGHENMIRKLNLFFRIVTIAKPHCSRNKEAFAVCQDYIPVPEFDPVQLTEFIELKNRNYSNLTGIHKKLVPYLCGDCYKNAFKVKRSESNHLNYAKREVLNILSTILKDHQEDVEILKKRVAERLPVYQITKDNCLQYDHQTSKAYFKGFTRTEIPTEESETSEEQPTNISQDASDENNVQKESEVNDSFSEKLKSLEIVDNSEIMGNKILSENENRRAKINNILGEKIKGLELENKGKFCGLGFNLGDWKFFTKGPSKDSLESTDNEELKDVYQGFHEIYEEIGKSHGGEYGNIQLLNKEEEIKSKVRNFISKENS